jgi:hypothetical protein
VTEVAFLVPSRLRTALRLRANGLWKLAISLLLLGSPAWADWKNITEDNAGVSYADPATIVRNGGNALMDSLFDHKDFQRMVEVGYFSQKVRAEYDCMDRRIRRLSVSLHAGHMGAGKVIYADDTPHEWEAVEAGTLNESLWRTACK